MIRAFGDSIPATDRCYLSAVYQWANSFRCAGQWGFTLWGRGATGHNARHQRLPLNGLRYRQRDGRGQCSGVEKILSQKHA